MSFGVLKTVGSAEGIKPLLQKIKPHLQKIFEFFCLQVVGVYSGGFSCINARDGMVRSQQTEQIRPISPDPIGNYVLLELKRVGRKRVRKG